MRHLLSVLISTLMLPLAAQADPATLPVSPFGNIPVDQAVPTDPVPALRTALGGIDAALSTALSTSDLSAIPVLSQELDRMPLIEGTLLDELQIATAASTTFTPARPHPSEPILIEDAAGRVILTTVGEVRDGAGALYDGMLAVGGKEGLTGLLPDRIAIEGALAVDTGGGRIAFVDRVLEARLSSADALRDRAIRRRDDLTAMLEDLRRLTRDLRAGRDQLIAIRDGVAPPLHSGGDICLDETARPTAFYASGGSYGGVSGVRVFGNIICLSPTTFLVDTGNALDTYYCGWADGARSCAYSHSEPYERSWYEPAGQDYYWFPGGGHFYYSPAN